MENTIKFENPVVDESANYDNRLTGTIRVVDCVEYKREGNGEKIPFWWWVRVRLTGLPENDFRSRGGSFASETAVLDWVNNLQSATPEQIERQNAILNPTLDETTIEINELHNTWGCEWRFAGDNRWHLGMDKIPTFGTDLFWWRGNAVENVLKLGLGEIVGETTGAYGGTKRAVRVNLEQLTDAVRKLNELQQKRENARGECAVCGAPAETMASTGLACADHYDELS